ncbi:hypothetical protein VaNZ11_000337 [Volvox africanus]|uniref:Nucleoporin Nup133/Nup155-like N-terminal domain-containing protein n=1 Tax=Volvox africanus TaxID=51714 RepID=A0ABQ5RLW9_9CHLO|nr:hypothetical protein VaNZ11_000337 [Volvox africanus]
MPVYGDTLGAYMLPRTVLELLQQPNGQQQCGVCADSGFAWLLAGKEVYLWRYREGKDARLRTLTLPGRPVQPCFVAVLAEGLPSSTSSGAVVSPTGLTAADCSLMVAVCDANGRLTTWLDAHHLSAPAEHLLSPCSSSPGLSIPNTDLNQPLVVGFAAARLNWGPQAGLLVALSAADGSLHLVKVSSNGIVPTQLSGAQGRPMEIRSGLAATWDTVLGFSRAISDPNSRYIRKVPAAKPAVALHLAPAAWASGMHYRLLVLTEDCLDCWAINAGVRPAETLQWSFSNCLFRQHDNGRGPFRAPAAPLFNLGLAVGVGGQGAGQRVAVWMAEPAFPGASATATAPDGRAGKMKQHVVQVLDVHPDGTPEVCSGLNERVVGYQEQPADGYAASRRRLLYASQSQACLLVRWEKSQPPDFHPDAMLVHDHDAADETGGAWACRALWTWSAASGTARPLADDPDTAAVDIVVAADGAARWVLLSATYGVMEIDAVAAQERGGPAGTADAAAGGLDATAAIANLLDAVLSKAAHIVNAGGNLQPLVCSLSRRLGALDTFALDNSALADYSTQLLDQLPKQWASGSTTTAMMKGGGVPLTVAEQLADKEFRHSLLLRCLFESGTLPLLSPRVRRVLIENADKLAVVLDLQKLQARQRGIPVASQRQDRPQVALPLSLDRDLVAVKAEALLSQLVAEAGRESSSREYEVLTPSEIFYARPSASVDRLLETVGRMAKGIHEQASRGSGNPGDNALATLRTTVRELGSVLGTIINAVLHGRVNLVSNFRLCSLEVAAQVGRPDWLSGKGPREAMKQLAAAVFSVRPLPPVPPSLELSHTLLGVLDFLLVCYKEAIRALGNREPDSSSQLVAEYRKVRSHYGDALLRDARSEMRTAGWGVGAPHRPLSPEALITNLESLFRDNHCYPQLFDICEERTAVDPSTRNQLYTYMATLSPKDSVDPSGDTMAQYVFQRLLADGRPADLLGLPTQFHAEVTAFLRSRQPATSDLLAVQLLKDGALGDAAGVLMQSVTAATRGAGGELSKTQAHHHGQDMGQVAVNLGLPQRLLSLARLAARASGKVEQEAHAARQLRLLDLQARLGMSVQDGPRQPAVILEEALTKASIQTHTTNAPESSSLLDSAKEAAVLAVEVMVLMDARTRKQHASKWQAAWKAVYDVDLWDQIAATPVGTYNPEEEELLRQTLLGTAVCRAARVCARGDILGFGSNGLDSAPLEQVATWLQSLVELDSRIRPGPADGSADARVARCKAEVMAALQLGLGTDKTLAGDNMAVD